MVTGKIEVGFIGLYHYVKMMGVIRNKKNDYLTESELKSRNGQQIKVLQINLSSKIGLKYEVIFQDKKKTLAMKIEIEKLKT
jgi:hypothetical protein